MGHRSHRNEWRTVSGPHPLVFLEANQPRQRPCRSGHQSWLRAGLWVRDWTAGPAATGTRRLAGPRREAQDELGCGERVAPRPSGAPAGSICAALREALKAATVLIEGDDPRIKH